MIGIALLLTQAAALISSPRSSLTMMGLFSFGKQKEQPRASEIFPDLFASLPSISGKTVAVTGSSQGLGYVTALSLAQELVSYF